MITLRAHASAASLTSMAAAGARAELSPDSIGLSGDHLGESNLLQWGDGTAAPAGLGRGDSARSLTLLAGLDWSTAEHSSGTLTASADRALFANTVGDGVGLILQRNLQDTRAVSAGVNAGLVTQYSLVFNISKMALTNALQSPTVQALNYDQDMASVGLRWRPSNATIWGLTIGDTLGRYPKFQQQGEGSYPENRYRQPNIDLSLVVQPPGASNLEAHVGYQTTRDDLNQPRDFSGATGRPVWGWNPVGRLHLSTRLARDTGQNSHAITVFGTPGACDYSQVNDSLHLQADHDLTSKVALSAAWQAVQRTLVNTIVNPFVPLSVQGKDHTDTVSLGARWAPLRSMLAGCDLSRVQRSASGALTGPLHDNVLSSYGPFQLQQ